MTDNDNLPEGVERGGRLASLKWRYIFGAIPSTTAQLAMLVYVAVSLRHLDARSVEADVAHVRTVFLVVTIGSLLLGVGLAVRSQIDMKRIVDRLAIVTTGLSRGRLHHDVPLVVHG